MASSVGGAIRHNRHQLRMKLSEHRFLAYKTLVNTFLGLLACLIHQLLSDAADEPGVLPLLQETMGLLWEEMENRTLSLDAYQQLSKITDRTFLSCREDQVSELKDNFENNLEIINDDYLEDIGVIIK